MDLSLEIKCHPSREKPDWANDTEAEISGHVLALDALPSVPPKYLFIHCSLDRNAWSYSVLINKGLVYYI